MAFAQYSGASPATVALPAGVVPGDLLVAQLAFDNGTDGLTLTAPAGWTFVRRDDELTSFGQALYFRVATAAEPLTALWSVTNNPLCTVQLLVYRGVDPVSPLDGAVGAHGDGTALLAPALTTTAAGDLLVVVFGHDSSLTTLAADVTLTQRAFSNTNKTLVATDLQLAAPGVTGPWAATAGATNQWAAQALALKRP